MNTSLTNLLTTITLVVSTNWHKLDGLNYEAQVVKRETVLTAVFEGATNQIVLKTEFECLPGVRAWGWPAATMTNLWLKDGAGLYWTNSFWPNKSLTNVVIQLSNTNSPPR